MRAFTYVPGKAKVTRTTDQLLSEGSVTEKELLQNDGRTVDNKSDESILHLDIGSGYKITHLSKQSTVHE